MLNVEARIAELTATCEKQGKRIVELVELHAKYVEATEVQVAALRARIANLRKSKDLCPVCLTWSWAPCNEGVLCQCCNDSRIAVLWKGRAEELREAAQPVVDMWEGKDGACVEIRVIEALRAALAKGDGP